MRSHIILLRKTEFYHNTNKKILYYISAIRLHLLQNKYVMHIPINTCDVGLSIAHVGPIVINSKAKIGKNCRIYVGVNIGEGSRRVPTIGDNVFIGPGCKIFNEIMIADGCKIGANTVVNKSFNIENSIVAGIPARLLKIDDVEKC